MSDAELLDLAAKAMRLKYMNGALWDGRDVVEYSWNPLTDDGDALRLAVKLRLEVFFEDWSDGETVIVQQQRVIEAENIVESDPYSATRRAIVRAAAEIGKGMK